MLSLFIGSGRIMQDGLMFFGEAVTDLLPPLDGAVPTDEAPHEAGWGLSLLFLRPRVFLRLENNP